MTTNWSTYQERYRNSVVQIRVQIARHSISRPYKAPETSGARGTGFFIDAQRGLLLTNNHVIDSASEIICRVPKIGKTDLRMRTVSMCHEKDMALCQIYAEDLEVLHKAIGPDLSVLDLHFGDSLEVKETEPCMVMGYPHGMNEIKLTIGTISGFNANAEGDDSEYETWEDSPSYIQTQTPINGGNSGGPIFNARGEVIGVVAAGIFLSQSTGFFIPARTVQGILAAFLAPIANTTSAPALGEASALIPRGGVGGFPHILHMPRLSFEWNETNPALMKYLGLSPETTGILVTKVNKNSCLLDVLENDFISAISVDLTIPCGMPGSPDKCRKESLVGVIDNFGDVTTDEKSLAKRKMALKEVFDMVPLGNKIILDIWRAGVHYRHPVTYTRVSDPEKQPLHMLCLHYEPIDWELVGGLIITPLTLNYIAGTDDLSEYAKGKKLYEHHLVITQILPGTEASRIKSLSTASIIESINGVKVSKLEELRSVLRLLPADGFLVVKMVKGQVFVVDVKQMVREDLAAMKAIEMPTSHPYLLSHLIPKSDAPPPSERMSPIRA